MDQDRAGLGDGPQVVRRLLAQPQRDTVRTADCQQTLAGRAAGQLGERAEAGLHRVLLSYLNPESESYRGRELGEPQRLPEMVLRVCSCLIFPTLIRRSPTSLCLRSLTGQRLFPRRSLSPTRSRTCCRLSHPSHQGMMFRRSANEASSVEEIAKPVVSGTISGL